MKIKLNVTTYDGKPFIYIESTDPEGSVKERMLNLFLTEGLKKGVTLSKMGSYYIIEANTGNKI